MTQVRDNSPAGWVFKGTCPGLSIGGRIPPVLLPGGLRPVRRCGVRLPQYWESLKSRFCRARDGHREDIGTQKRVSACRPIFAQINSRDWPYRGWRPSIAALFNIFFSFTKLVIRMPGHHPTTYHLDKVPRSLFGVALPRLDHNKRPSLPPDT